MNLSTIVKIVKGMQITNCSGTLEFENGLTSDLMSDVLRLDFDHGILITGLNNIQTIRTAEMSDIHCVIIARDKQATQEMIDLATKTQIAIIETKHTVFYVSALLFQNGIKPLY